MAVGKYSCVWLPGVFCGCVFIHAAVYLYSLPVPCRKWGLPQSDMNVMFRSLSRLCDVLMNFFSEVRISVSSLSLSSLFSLSVSLSHSLSLSQSLFIHTLLCPISYAICEPNLVPYKSIQSWWEGTHTILG